MVGPTSIAKWSSFEVPSRDGVALLVDSAASRTSSAMAVFVNTRTLPLQSLSSSDFLSAKHAAFLAFPLRRIGICNIGSSHRPDFQCLHQSSSVIRRSFSVRASSASPEETTKLPTVGFLGLGIMGTAMARNLVKAGYDVTVWNRTANKCQQLVEEGAKHGKTPAETANACDITFAMLADPASALQVACGPDGAVEGLGERKGYVDVSTVDGDTSKTISKAITSTGAAFLEAPVSGSKKPAEDGKLIFLTAGDRQLYDRVAPILDVMGKSRFFLGEAGNGAAMKLIINMIMGSMMASFSEGLVLGSKVGLDQNTIIEVLSQGAISAPMWAMKGPSMVQGVYSPAFPLKHQQKDLRLALALAEQVNQPTPVAASVNELYKFAKASGLGDKDFSAVIEAVKLQFKPS